MPTATESEIDVGSLGLDRGAHLIINRSLTSMAPGDRLRVSGTDAHLRVHLRAWARAGGHAVVNDTTVVRGDAGDRRFIGANRAGTTESVEEVAAQSWGLAARGALVEEGAPSLPGADLDERQVVWSDLASKLYAQAAANQWDPATAIDWTPSALPFDVEIAVIQVMTYLIENELAALMVPARFIGRIHPHFREAIQFLCTQIADEARHVEVFTRRAGLTNRPMGVSGSGGRASLRSLFDEPEWVNASFLLSVLGEGSFLSLLAFLERWAPDPVTARVAHLTLQDEARHVAFALGHLGEYVTSGTYARDRLRGAIERRHDALRHTSGLSPQVHDSLVILAAGAWDPASIALGWDRVQQLQVEMHEGRTRRLVRLGFSAVQAAELSALHTRNFM